MKVIRTELVLLLCTTPGLVVAQTTNATLVGDVLDASGAAVADAKVSITNTGTGIARDALTNSSGSYRIFPLNPGVYDVSITKAGFRTQTVKAVTLEVAQVAKIDFKLDVGAVTETINVNSAAPVLQTQEA